MNNSFTPDFDGTSDTGNAIEVPMERLRRKGVGMAASEAAWLGIQHVIEPNTTLNQAFNILPDVRHEFPHDRYSCGYFSLGVKGYKPGIGPEGRPTKTPYQSDPQDLQLYYPIPISMRPYSNRLTPDQAKNYFLKTDKEHEGVKYEVYWAKGMDKSESTAKTYMNKTGESKPVEYVYTEASLDPTPKLPPAAGTPTRIVANMLVLTGVTAHLSAFDVAELKNTTMILFGVVEDVSEIAFIQAAEREVTDADVNGVPYQRKELIDAQVGMSGNTLIPVSFTTGAIPSEYRLGASEPLYTSTPE